MVLSNTEQYQLISLVEDGPLWAGDLLSRDACNTLVDQGLAANILVKGRDGFVAATHSGREAYKDMLGTSLGERPDTVREAKAQRLAEGVIIKAKKAFT